MVALSQEAIILYFPQFYFEAEPGMSATAPLQGHVAHSLNEDITSNCDLI